MRPHLTSEVREVGTPGVGVGDPLADQPPQLLDGIERGGVGREGEELQAGVLRQGVQRVGMEVDRPIINDQIDLLCVGILARGL